VKSERMTTRSSTLSSSDIEAIVYHRHAVFLDMGYNDESALEAMSARFRPWLRQKMEAGEYFAWFAIAPDSSIAAGLGLWLMDWPSHMVAGGQWRGNILNVYTEPAYRRIGMARALMQIALDWCAAIRFVRFHRHERNASDTSRHLTQTGSRVSNPYTADSQSAKRAASDQESMRPTGSVRKSRFTSSNLPSRWAFFASVNGVPGGSASWWPQRSLRSRWGDPE
jgi:GNAT superfamily N-acetyltransferase